MMDLKRGVYRGGKCLRGHDSLRYKSGSCIECSRDKARKRNIEKRGELAEYHRQWYQRNKELVKERTRIYQRNNKSRVYGNRLSYAYKIKKAVINAYSGGTMSCKWCGVADIDVLCLDHIYDDGKLHRKGMPSRNIYWYAYKHKFPYGLQVLCYNCNMKKELTCKRQGSLGYRQAKVFMEGDGHVE